MLGIIIHFRLFKRYIHAQKSPVHLYQSAEGREKEGGRKEERIEGWRKEGGKGEEARESGQGRPPSSLPYFTSTLALLILFTAIVSYSQGL